MTAIPNPIDAPAVLEYLQQAEPDLLRSMLAAFVQALMGADADAQCGAEYGARSPDRTNQRNGYRQREWDTRAGTIELSIPSMPSLSAAISIRYGGPVPATVACSLTSQPPHSCPVTCLCLSSSRMFRTAAGMSLRPGRLIVEIVDTNGNPERFDFTDFAITD